MARIDNIHHNVSGNICRAALFIALMIVLCTAVHADQPFNVEVDLPSTYQVVHAGDDIWFTINLLNLANPERIDVTIDYAMLDASGRTLATRSKTVAVETQASFVADLKVPQDAAEGSYHIGVDVASSLGNSTASVAFAVQKQEDNTIYYVAAAIVALIIILIIVSIKSKPLIEKLRVRAKVKSIIKKKIGK